MKTISNAEIAKKICENEEIASCYTFSEILYIVNLCKSIEKKEREKMEFESITELEILKYAYDCVLEKWSIWKERSESRPDSEYAKEMKSLLDKQLNELGSKIFKL